MQACDSRRDELGSTRGGPVIYFFNCHIESVVISDGAETQVRIEGGRIVDLTILNDVEGEEGED